VIGLLSLSCLEDDGVLFALFTALIVFAVAAAAIWETVVGALWIGRFWF
jgi:hypothetical protein